MPTAARSVCWQMAAKFLQIAVLECGSHLRSIQPAYNRSQGLQVNRLCHADYPAKHSMTGLPAGGSLGDEGQGCSAGGAHFVNLAPKYIVKKYFIFDTLDRLSLTALATNLPMLQGLNKLIIW